MEVFSILLCVTLSLPLVFLLSRHGSKKLPPGPPALLFIAKLLVSGRLDHILHVLHARHGPIISIWFLSTFVFVADRHLAHSILVKGGGNFDSRPPPNAIMQLFFPHGIGSSPYGTNWRLLRRNLNVQVMHPSRIRLFAPARQRASNAMVSSLLHGNGAGEAVASRFVTMRPLLARSLFQLLVEMCLGGRLGQEVLDEMQEMNRQVFLAWASFPGFSILPVLTMRRRWARCVTLRERQSKVLLPLILASCGTPCYAGSLLELRVAEEGGRPLTEAEMISLCSDFLVGAMDTSVTLMEWIMAELVNHPDAQAKVYKEVRGKPELSEDDLRGMPYLRAVVLESLRLHPAAHLLPPHAVQHVAEVGGYTVPKGAVINFLVADFGLDEEMWTTATREFRPERFLVNGGDDLDITTLASGEMKMAPFGAGRRMCPGYTLALLHAQYFVGSLVRDFQWLPPAQAAVDMNEELIGVFIVMKHRLRARVLPRTSS
ncbi:hypothetical protein ACQJBY_035365 [Aegilops geniculata]